MLHLPILTAPSSVPVSGQIFNGVLVTEKHGQSFTWELELRNEDIMIISAELFLRGNNFSNFFPGFACLQPRFSVVRRFVLTGD